MSTEFITPVGRIVQGNPMEKQTTDQQGKPLTIKTGPNAGQPTQSYFVALAFAKNDPAWPAFHEVLRNTARTAWPQFFDAAGNCTNPSLSMKIIDGDGVDRQGQPWSAKEGFAGHWVVRFASTFAPKCFHVGKYDPMQQIQDPAAIKRGWYGRVSGTVAGNNNAQNPGIYVNLSLFELSAEGVEIVSGPQASTVFGASTPALPAGASPLRNVPPAVGAPALPATPAAPGPGAPAPTFTAPGLPTSPAVPVASGFAAGIAAPPAPPTPASSGPVYTMLPAAQGFTREQYHAQGWTDDALVSGGMMTIQPDSLPY